MGYSFDKDAVNQKIRTKAAHPKRSYVSHVSETTVIRESISSTTFDEDELPPPKSDVAAEAEAVVKGIGKPVVDLSLELSTSGRLKTVSGNKAYPDEEQGSEEKSSVVYRDQDGFVITREKWEELQREQKGPFRKKRRQGTTEPMPVVPWGRGLRQEKEELERRREEERIIQEPFIRRDIDSHYDKELREMHRRDDPLADMLNNSPTDLSEGNTAGKTKSKKCLFPSPPNRFDIKAGYRWDGVIRGNGFENRFLEAQNRKQLTAQQHVARSRIEDEIDF